MENNQPSFLLKPNNEITDDIGMAYGKKFKTLANETLSTRNPHLAQMVIVRLINRYRILLSRARKGLVIFCEDKQTSESLKKCITLSRGD